MSCIVITKGLHPPWNQGEVVATRNFVKVLSRVYDKVLVFSLIDHVRGFEEPWRHKLPNVQIKYFHKITDLVNTHIHEFNSSYDIHIANISITSVPRNLIRQADRIYIYLYTLRNLTAISTQFKSIVLLFGSIVYKKLNIVTISPILYEVARKIHSRCFYTPTPLDIPPVTNSVDLCTLNILCLTHANYLRFPVDRVLPALVLLARRFKDELKVRIIVSAQRYAKYTELYNILTHLVKRYNLESVVNVELRDLNESEKVKAYGSSNVFLYPAIGEVAIDPPLTVLEAMSYGLCVIATDVQSLPNILRDNRGLVIKRSRITQELSEVLVQLIENREQIRAYGVRARRYIEVIHNMNTVVSLFQKPFRQ